MAVAVSETIGERLRRLREERGLTQRDLACPGVTPQYVSRIERGDRNASVKALRKLSERLDVSVEFLETGRDPAAAESRAFRLADIELALRLGDEPTGLEQELRRLHEEALRAGDEPARTRAALALGTLAARTGDHAQAIERLEAALSAAWVTPATHADSYAALGHSLVALGRYDDAVELFRSCIAQLQAQSPVNDGILTRLATYLSYALVDAGQLDEARSAIESALVHGEASSDLYARVRVHWASARLAASAGELAQAERDITRAITLLESSEDTLALARAHLVAAEIALWEVNHVDAADHLASAEKLLPDDSAIEDRLFLLVQQAFVAARTGQAAQAMDKANNALGLLGADEDPTIRGRAHWALAEAYAAAGAIDSARAAFTTASDLIPPGSKHAHRLLEAWQLAVPR